MTTNLIKTKLGILRKTGDFSLLSQKIDISTVFRSPELQKNANLIKTLNLTRTNFRTARAFPTLNSMTSLIADFSELENFENFLSFPKLAKISIKHTPVASKKNFKLSLYLLFGDSLSSINGTIISEEIRRKALEYPNFARDLINKGWIAVYPPPSDDEFDDLCQNYGIDKPKSISQSEEEERKENNQSQSEEEDIELQYQYLIQSIRDKQEEQLKDCADYLGFEEEEIEEEENDEEFAYNIAGLFLDHGIELGSCTNEEILAGIDSLCRKVLQA